MPGGGSSVLSLGRLGKPKGASIYLGLETKQAAHLWGLEMGRGVLGRGFSIRKGREAWKTLGFQGTGFKMNGDLWEMRPVDSLGKAVNLVFGSLVFSTFS